MKTFKLLGIIFLLLAAIAITLVANHRTAQSQKTAQIPMSRVEMMAIDEIIETNNIIYNDWMGKSCYDPQPDATYTYANSCAFLTASGTLGGMAVSYADNYYDDPACYYRIQAQLNNIAFDKWQCTAMNANDFDGWWGPATWNFLSTSLPQSDNATQDVLAIAAIMSNNQGFVFTEWGENEEEGHVWALARIQLRQHTNGQNVTYSVCYEIINSEYSDIQIVKETWGTSCENFMGLFTDVHGCYVY